MSIIITFTENTVEITQIKAVQIKKIKKGGKKLNGEI